MNPTPQSFPEEDDRPVAVHVPARPLPSWLVVVSLLLFTSVAVFTA